MKKILSLLTLGAMAVVAYSVSSKNAQEVKADGKTELNVVTNAALSHVRFPGNPDDGSSFGNERQGFGTNWEQSQMPALSSSQSSFARFVIEAPVAGTYQIAFTVEGGTGYPLNLYVNSESNVISKSVSSTNWGTPATEEFDVTLNQGKNVLVLQVNNWGHTRKISFPSELVLHNGRSKTSGEYNVMDFVFQATYLSASTELFNPESEVQYQALPLDGNVSFEGSATLFIDPDDANTALDLKLKSRGEASLKVALNGDYSKNTTLSLPNYDTTTAYTYHITKAQLDALGYDVTQENSVRLSADAGSVQVIGAKESSVEGEVDPIPEVEPTDPNTIDAQTIASKVKINGRSPVTNDGICLDWSLSGIDFMFTGAGAIYANFEVDSNTQNTRFAVEIDGNPIGYVTPSENANITLGSLEQGTHRITLYKTSEAAGNLVRLVSMTLPEGSSIAKPAEKSLKFEILGDSITCANQIAMGVEDAYWGYARQLAAAYNAEANLVSVSGRGLRQGFNSEEGWPASTQNQIKDLWHKKDFFRDQTTAWNTADYTPDVVVCSLGSNDLGDYILTCQGCSVEGFMNDVVSFSQTLRTAYPNAKIVWAYGSFVNRKYIAEYKTAVASLNDNNIQFVEFPQLMHGDSGHANDINHDLMASILSSKIAEMLNVQDPYNRRFDYTTVEAEDSMEKGGTRKGPGDAGDIYWSNSAYVGDMGFDSESTSYPTSIDEIASDMSNISYLKVAFNAPKSARYTIRIGFATIGTATVGYRVDNGAWRSVDLVSNDWAGGHGVYTPVEVDLAKGNHYIYFTSALNSGGWVNYDFFDIIRGQDLTAHSVTVTGNEHVQFSGLPTSVLDGDSFSFTATLDANYSKSTLVVKANGQALTPVNGVYTVSNVTADVAIAVEGVTLNTWTVTFKDVEGGSVVATKTFAVGETITVPDTAPTRDGYVFDGWNMTVTTMPNNDVVIFAKWKAAPQPEPQPAKRGCGGNIETASIILSSLSLVGIGLISLKLFKKSKDE